MLQHATFIMFLRSTTTDLNDFSGGVLTEGDGSSKCCTVSKRLLQDKQDATHEETTQNRSDGLKTRKYSCIALLGLLSSHSVVSRMTVDTVTANLLPTATLGILH